MIGVSWARSQASSRAALQPGRASRTSALGRTTPGALPPPTADSPSITDACQPCAASAAASASARARSCSSGACSIRSTGTVSAARPLQCSTSVASSAA